MLEKLKKKLLQIRYALIPVGFMLESAVCQAKIEQSKANNGTTNQSEVMTSLGGFGTVLDLITTIIFWVGAAVIIVGIIMLISGVIKKDTSGYEQSAYIIGGGALACACKGVYHLIITFTAN